MNEQRVWRNISKPTVTGVGYFVTEVWEVTGEPSITKYYEETLDDGYILLSSYHFFTKEALQDWLSQGLFGDTLPILTTIVQPR